MTEKSIPTPASVDPLLPVEKTMLPDAIHPLVPSTEVLPVLEKPNITKRLGGLVSEKLIKRSRITERTTDITDIDKEVWWGSEIDEDESRKENLETKEDVKELDEVPTSLDTKDIVTLLDREKVVRDAPRFSEIARDTTRTNEIKHIVSNRATEGRSATVNDEVRIVSEYESAADLQDFLRTFVDTFSAEPSTDKHDRLIRNAKDMLENLTFIGEKERAEAVKGISEYWKDYLRRNPAAQLCPLAQVSDSKKVKSDKYLLDSILGEFSDDDLEEFKDRIVLDIEEITADPENVKIVLLDDWIITGSQMKIAAGKIKNKPALKKYASSIEIQILTSPQHRIDNGLKINAYSNDPGNIVPIKSYFRSHKTDVETEYEEHMAYESGSHSSVDYDFETTYIWTMLEEITKLHKKNGTEPPRKTMPLLTGIDRPYRNARLINIERFKIANNSKVNPGRLINEDVS